ncbi:MAG: HDOD domain-containing protein [candidate division Zixibacteria bacterium]|nr:HDOD domain-containing protein [candidate division Zixibacteria bacterium]
MEGKTNGDIFEQILKDHHELSSLPQTLSEVIRVIKDETSSAQDLATVLSRDPALSVKVLRIVNSPFYGVTREVTTLTQAVVTIGTRAVSALALSTSVYDVAGKWNSTVDRLRFWRHSLEVAIACRMIAEAMRYPRPEEAFVCGLLHDIGLLVLEKSFPEKFQSVWKQVECGEDLVQMEESVWSTNHARVGQFLLEQWRIPSVICEAVGQHHNSFPPGADDPDFQLAQIVALSDGISRFHISSARPETAYEIEARSVLQKNLGLRHDALAHIEEHLFGRLVDEARFLEIEIGSTEDLLVEANRLIYEHYRMTEDLLKENKQMQQEIARVNLEKAALETLKTITATFNHYINNAAATILGRSQLVELSIQSGEVDDPSGKTAGAMTVIIDSIKTIQLVLDELKKLDKFNTTVYHDDTYIIDIENKIRERLEQIRQPEPAH